MATYEVTAKVPGAGDKWRQETVECDRFEEENAWLQFFLGDELVVQLKVADVARVERKS